MDNSGKNNNDSAVKVTSDVASELAHITQVMYKKNFELAEKNKILSLLRKIDELILSTVTDAQEIAQKVADTIAEDAGFKAVVIYLIEKEGILSKAALSKTELILTLRQYIDIDPFQTEIEITDENNKIAEVDREQKMQIIQDPRPLLYPSISQDILNNILELNEIKSSLIYPLKIRNESLGVLVVCLSESEKDISLFQRDLIERLNEVIGIAIDNALLYQKIQESNEKLKQLDKLKDDFVSVASHELRTPMTAIKSYLSMVLAGQGGDLTERTRLYVQRSYNSVDRLIKLVNDMLNISRIDSGRMSMQIRAVNIDALIREVVEDIGPRAKELELSVDIDRNPVIPEVLADPDKIKEVIYNLIGNAMKFTPKSGRITVSYKQKDSFVEVAVRDTGAGMDAEGLSKLFQKFGILPGTYAANQPSFGTGLGLYISRSLIELHGGKIWADSEGKEKGSTFTFTLKVFNQEELDKFNEKYKQQEPQNISVLEQTDK